MPWAGKGAGGGSGGGCCCNSGSGCCEPEEEPIDLDIDFCNGCTGTMIGGLGQWNGNINCDGQSYGLELECNTIDYDPPRYVLSVQCSGIDYTDFPATYRTCDPFELRFTVTEDCGASCTTGDVITITGTV